ncbi:hypothetical protein Tco_0979850 [Tanacetum coccineum]
MKQDKAKQVACDEKLVPSDDKLWLTIEKVKKSSSCPFNIDNKTCQIDADIFRKFLDISPKVTNQEFTIPPSSDTLREFLHELSYKGKLTSSSEMYVDHINQPWRTFAAIINKCLSGNTLSNDRLRPSRIEILWGMYHEVKVDYSAMIWEDLQYQFDNKQTKVKRRKIMPYLRFTKAIIRHFMSQHKSISKREGLPYHTIANDGLLERLKFINKGDLYQVYGKPIPNTWITDEIKESEAYQMYFKYSTSLIPLKKSRDRVVKVGKITAMPKKPTKPRKKPSKKKQVLRDESPESEGEFQNRQFSKKIRTPRAVAAQLELATQKAIKDSQHASQLKHTTRSSSEGTGVSLRVPDELVGVLAVSSEGVGISPKTNKDKNEDDDEDDVSEDEEVEEKDDEENVDEENEEESDDDDKSFDITNTDDERTESDSDNHDMSKEGKTIAKTEEEEIATFEHEEDDTKGEDQKTKEELKGDDQAKEAEVGVLDLVTNKEKSEFLQSILSHSISSNFSNQFLVNSPNASLIGTILENTDKEITSLMDIEIQQDVPLELKQADPSAAILESIKSQELTVKKSEYKEFIKEPVTNEAKNHLSKILPIAISDFTTLVIQSTIKETLEQTPVGKETKKMRTRKEAESSKKSSTPKESTKGKPPSKSSKTGKSASADQSVKEPEHEADPKIPKKDWFQDSPKAEVLDPEWNTIKTIYDTPEQLWFNKMIDNITREVLVGPMFNLLKGTCKSCVELEYNMEECYQTMTDQLNWTNSVDMSKPLLPQDKEGQLVIPAPAARYIMEGIEDMIPTLWSLVILDYDKDVALGISY